MLLLYQIFKLIFPYNRFLSKSKFILVIQTLPSSMWKIRKFLRSFSWHQQITNKKSTYKLKYKTNRLDAFCNKF